MYKTNSHSALPLATMLILFSVNASQAANPKPMTAATSPRVVTSFDRDWRFSMGDKTGADAATYDDSTWRKVDVPHDWMIEGQANPDSTKPGPVEGPFDQSSPAGAGGGYLNGGVAWYRKAFTIPTSDRGKQKAILFDGAYQNCDISVNGHHLGFHPYGFTSFSYDLTPYLNYGADSNEISVRMNVVQPGCRWYSGAGLYRDVWLITTSPVHVDQWGTFVSTPKVAASSADVRVQTQVRNDGATSALADLTTTLYAPSGAKVASGHAQQSIATGATASFEQTVPVASPRLWDTTSPTLYKAVSEVRVNGSLTDSYTTSFGIRTIEFTRDNGFLLNGKRVQIKGVCDHADLGCLGSIALRRGLQRQLEILKGMGCNAIRTSHNPPSPELLDLCDRMGFLVMDEAFDEWKLSKTKNGYGQWFDDWSQIDLKSMLERDRNHPSIIIWSTGNEVTEGFIANGYKTAQPLIDTCHAEDPTRPVTSAAQQPYNALKYGFDKVFDVFGANYSPSVYQDSRAHGVEPIVGSETASQVDSRGDYGLVLDPQGDVQINARPKGWKVSSYDLYRPGWATHPETETLALRGAPWVAGEFVWTGFDYIGEPTPWGWPARSSYFGINDLCGFPKDRYYFYKSIWTDNPIVHIIPASWNWSGFEGKSIPVNVTTNADSVELFLNGKSLGTKKFPQDCEVLSIPAPAPKNGEAPQPPTEQPTLHLAWSVPYTPGIIKAVATKAGKIVAADQVVTAGDPAKIVLSADRLAIADDGHDLCFIKATIIDKEGNVCPNADNEIKYSLTGTGASLTGLDNGDPTNHEPFQGTQHKAFHGLALAVLRSGYDHTGEVTLSATADGLTGSSVTVAISK